MPIGAVIKVNGEKFQVGERGHAHLVSQIINAVDYEESFKVTANFTTRMVA